VCSLATDRSELKIIAGDFPCILCLVRGEGTPFLRASNAAFKRIVKSAWIMARALHVRLDRCDHIFSCYCSSVLGDRDQIPRRRFPGTWSYDMFNLCLTIIYPVAYYMVIWTVLDAIGLYCLNFHEIAAWRIRNGHDLSVYHILGMRYSIAVIFSTYTVHGHQLYVTGYVLILYSPVRLNIPETMNAMHFALALVSPIVSVVCLTVCFL